MHDRLKRTARKRGNYLRAQPIIQKHTLRDAEQRAEWRWLGGWADLTPEQARQVVDQTIERAKAVRPAWNPFRL